MMGGGVIQCMCEEGCPICTHSHHSCMCASLLYLLQVISARRGEFETGFERRGQTR